MTTTQNHLATAAPKVARLVTTVRDELRQRRALRAAARRLEQDLATYTSPREIDDLLAALDRGDDADVSPIRMVLSRNREEYYRRRPLAS